MPIYMFTYHGYATWLPDRDRGYVHRQRGLQPSDTNMADAYRRNQHEDAAWFDPPIQRVLVETARQTGEHLDAIIHAVGTEPTHVHIIASWQHDRTWKSLRASIRSALTRTLNKAFKIRTWFSDSPSRNRVRDYEHLDYLILEYIPNHQGITWVREEDRLAALKRREQSL